MAVKTPGPGFDGAIKIPAERRSDTLPELTTRESLRKMIARQFA